MIADVNHMNYYSTRSMHAEVIAAGAYTIIITVFLIAYIFDETHHFLELVWLFVGAVFLIVAGILGLVCYCDKDSNNQSDNTIVYAVFALVCGIIMLGDWIRELLKK